MRRRSLAIVAAAAFALAASFSAGVARAGNGPTTYYLSLGDSLAASFHKDACRKRSARRPVDQGWPAVLAVASLRLRRRQ
jgi:hypothetical protein